MPVNHRSNNKVLPANARAVDVAVRALRDIAPVQQRKYHNAFLVQGYEAILYTRLSAGLICSCQANRTVAQAILNEEGKMNTGTIDQMLTGGLEFSVNRYGATKSGPRPPDIPLARDEQFFGGLESENHTPFPLTGTDLSDPFVDLVGDQGASLDEFASTFDADAYDLNGTKCGCCFGTGFVGGYSILNGWRKVIAPHSPEVYKVDGTIEVHTKPNFFLATEVTFDVVLPAGTLTLDSFCLWDNVTRVQYDSATIDSLELNQQLLLALCDGRPHRLVFRFNEPKAWTHLELQGNQSVEPSLIEFPKITKSSNISLADLTDTVQVVASPLIPHLSARDVLVESSFGKAFLIGSATLWNDRDRRVHGWECQARVVQPSEIVSLLPHRNILHQRTTNAVRDNQAGIRRT